MEIHSHSEKFDGELDKFPQQTTQPPLYYDRFIRADK